LLTPGKSTFLFATIKLCFLGGGENGWLRGLWLPTMLTHWDLLFLPYILAHVHTYIYTKGSLINFKYFAVKILKKIICLLFVQHICDIAKGTQCPIPFNAPISHSTQIHSFYVTYLVQQWRRKGTKGRRGNEVHSY